MIHRFFQRVLEEQQLFMRCHTALFTVVLMASMFWALAEAVEPWLLLVLALVCWGGGWLLAFYMWRLNIATEFETGPLRPSRREENKEQNARDA